VNANGFSFDFVYLSAEYPEWVNEGFNDTFYAILVDHLAGEARQNISFDDFGHEIEVDNAYFESPPVTDIGGTGYDLTCTNEVGPLTSVCGSSTTRGTASTIPPSFWTTSSGRPRPSRRARCPSSDRRAKKTSGRKPSAAGCHFFFDIHQRN
jgi:hypothetical protein